MHINHETMGLPLDMTLHLELVLSHTHRTILILEDEHFMPILK